MTDLDRLIEAVEAKTWHGDTTSMFDHAEHMNAYRAFGGSLDAALSLHKALLPRCKWGIHEPLKGLFRAYVSTWSALRPMPFTAEAEDPARALLLATLRAYRATQEQQK